MQKRVLMANETPKTRLKKPSAIELQNSYARINRQSIYIIQALKPSHIPYFG